MNRHYLLIILSIVLLFFGEAKALDIMLPKVYDTSIDISGWMVSEKLDGVRGFWTGTTLLSKNGEPFRPPPEFLDNFPDFALEGEIWGGRGTFEQTVGIVKRQADSSGWATLKFAIFDVPNADGGFRQRLAQATDWFSQHPSHYAFVIRQTPIRNAEALQKELTRVEALGGEGLIVRKPDTLYTSGRSSDILKVKSYMDTEAVVLDHLPGSGKNKGRMGSLLVQLANGKRFKIGTGFSDEQRQNPPAIGSTITFKYYGLYQSGIPKFPSFQRIRP